MVNGHLEIPGESFADKFRAMERFQAEVRPLAPASSSSYALLQVFCRGEGIRGLISGFP